MCDAALRQSSPNLSYHQIGTTAVCNWIMNTSLILLFCIKIIQSQNSTRQPELESATWLPAPTQQHLSEGDAFDVAISFLISSLTHCLFITIVLIISAMISCIRIRKYCKPRVLVNA